MGMSPVRFHLGKNGTVLIVRVFLNLERSGKAVSNDRQNGQYISFYLIDNLLSGT